MEGSMTTMTFRLPTKFAQTTEKLSKYRNTRVEFGGHKFSSKLEAKRYSELMLLERAGEIRNLRLQPRYNLLVNGQKICAYVGDFEYKTAPYDQLVTEDTKGFLTPEFKLKAKLFKAVMGRDIVLVRKK
jgi:hypothetical protein